jgi:hypothetical protein
MPDPQVVYIVSAAVVLALVAWVVIVLLRAPKQPPAVSVASRQGEHNEPAGESKT